MHAANKNNLKCVLSFCLFISLPAREQFIPEAQTLHNHLKAKATLSPGLDFKEMTDVAKLRNKHGKKITPLIDIAKTSAWTLLIRAKGFFSWHGTCRSGT